MQNKTPASQTGVAKIWKNKLGQRMINTAGAVSQEAGLWASQSCPQLLCSKHKRTNQLGLTWCYFPSSFLFLPFHVYRVFRVGNELWWHGHGTRAVPTTENARTTGHWKKPRNRLASAPSSTPSRVTIPDRLNSDRHYQTIHLLLIRSPRKKRFPFSLFIILLVLQQMEGNYHVRRG